MGKRGCHWGCTIPKLWESWLALRLRVAANVVLRTVPCAVESKTRPTFARNSSSRRLSLEREFKDTHLPLTPEEGISRLMDAFGIRRQILPTPFFNINIWSSQLQYYLSSRTVIFHYLLLYDLPHRTPDFADLPRPAIRETGEAYAPAILLSCVKQCHKPFFSRRKRSYTVP